MQDSSTLFFLAQDMIHEAILAWILAILMQPVPLSVRMKCALCKLETNFVVILPQPAKFSCHSELDAKC